MSNSIEEQDTRSPLLTSDTTGAQEANKGSEPIKVYSGILVNQTVLQKNQPLFKLSPDSHEHYRSIQMSNIQMVHQRQGKPAQRMLLLCHFGFKVLALLTYLFRYG